MKIAISDADSLIALVHQDDVNHDKAVTISKALSEQGITVIFPNTALIEAITALKRALNLPDKSEFVNKEYQKGAFVVEYINEDIQMLSSKFYEKAVSKRNTAFDAVVAACAEKLEADVIFSFDDWYQKLGFKLAEELV